MSDEKTDQLVARWRAAKDRLEAAKRDLNAAEVGLTNATNELAKWLTPEDAKPGERFSVWVEGILIDVGCDPISKGGSVFERPGRKSA